jgi:hypothetical protein
MKKKNKYRKELQSLARDLGLLDEPVITGQIKPGTTDSPYFILVNNQRRFVKGLLKLPFAEQRERIERLRNIIAAEAAAEAAKAKG